MASITKITFTLPDNTELKYAPSRDGTYFLGTSEENQITLADPSLAAKHAKLIADETSKSRWFLQELGDGSIRVLEDGSKELIGHTHLSVSITSDSGSNADLDSEAGAQGGTLGEQPKPDNSEQLARMLKAQELRDLKIAAIMIAICGILSFFAGVAWRLMQ